MDEDGPDVALRKLCQQPGVVGYVVLSKSGIPVKFHNMDNAKAVQYASLISELCINTREFLDRRLFQPDDDAADLKTIRLRTLDHEIAICPEDNYTLVLLHKTGEHAATEIKAPEVEELKKDEEGDSNE